MDNFFTLFIDLPVNLDYTIFEILTKESMGGDTLGKDAFDKLTENRQKAIIDHGIAEFSTKGYAEASTDKITQNSHISKGILFHYFGSKKEFYAFCLEQGMKRLFFKEMEPVVFGNFYDTLFSYLDENFSLYRTYHDEMMFINRAARESASEVLPIKNGLFAQYKKKLREKSFRMFSKAVQTLDQIEPMNPKTIEGLAIYVGAILDKYLALYNETPDWFFEKTDEIKSDMKEYIDLFLYGITRKKE